MFVLVKEKMDLFNILTRIRGRWSNDWGSVGMCLFPVPEHMGLCAVRFVTVCTCKHIKISRILNLHNRILIQRTSNERIKQFSSAIHALEMIITSPVSNLLVRYHHEWIATVKATVTLEWVPRRVSKLCSQWSTRLNFTLLEKQSHNKRFKRKIAFAQCALSVLNKYTNKYTSSVS